MSPASARQPVVYIPHGGGPWPFVELPRVDRGQVDALAGYLRGLPDELAAAGPRPRAVLVVSAHWEERVATVMSAAQPPLLYDYYGFPDAAYQIRWPAPGGPELGERVRELLGAAGFETGSDPDRGFDHGTFIPLKLMDPAAATPTLQLSLLASLDPAEHLALGRALAPLRDEGVLIIGSGMSYHDLRGFFASHGRAVSEQFDAWLVGAATGSPERRDQQLTRWADAPEARRAHPREEHLLPLMVVAGAAGADLGRLSFSGWFGEARISAFAYG